MLLNINIEITIPEQYTHGMNHASSQYGFEGQYWACLVWSYQTLKVPGREGGGDTVRNKKDILQTKPKAEITIAKHEK